MAPTPPNRLAPSEPDNPITTTKLSLFTAPGWDRIRKVVAGMKRSAESTDADAPNEHRAESTIDPQPIPESPPTPIVPWRTASERTEGGQLTSPPTVATSDVAQANRLAPDAYDGRMHAGVGKLFDRAYAAGHLSPTGLVLWALRRLEWEEVEAVLESLSPVSRSVVRTAFQEPGFGSHPMYDHGAVVEFPPETVRRLIAWRAALGRDEARALFVKQVAGKARTALVSPRATPDVDHPPWGPAELAWSTRNWRLFLTWPESAYPSLGLPLHVALEQRQRTVAAQLGRQGTRMSRARRDDA